jgi:SAM-dependent methyltransferase
MKAPRNPADVDGTTYDLRLLERSLAKWRRSPALRSVYGDIFGEVRGRLRPGPTLEIGSGIGLAKEFLPELTTSDVRKTAHVERAASAYELAGENGRWANVIAMDVLHHLREPLRFLAEAAGALRPGGRLVLVEPAATPWGRVFYRLAHHEPCLPAELAPPFDFSAGAGEFANMGMGWSLFVEHRAAVEPLLAARGLRIDEVRMRDFFAYPLTGGFSKPALLPAAALRALLAMERRLPQAVMRKIGLRMLVGLTRLDR